MFSLGLVLPVRGCIRVWERVYLGIGFVCSNLNHYISTLRLCSLYASMETFFLFLHSREVTLNAFAHTCSNVYFDKHSRPCQCYFIIEQFLYSHTLDLYCGSLTLSLSLSLLLLLSLHSVENNDCTCILRISAEELHIETIGIFIFIFFDIFSVLFIEFLNLIIY